MTESVHYQRVKEFLRRLGQPTPDKINIPAHGQLIGQAFLILEEVFELFDALGLEIHVDYLFKRSHQQEVPALLEDIELRIASTVLNLEKVADGCAGLSVTVMGMLVMLGIKDVDLLREVDESNLRKFGEGAGWNEKGKWVKPKGWQPPDLKRILDAQR